MSDFKDLLVGDIVWSRIIGYPFWPSIVCVDPVSNQFVKEGKNNRKYVHVRFCMDKGRRSWVINIDMYSGKDKLLSKYPNCLSGIKYCVKLMDTWGLAVKEADSLLKIIDRKKRIVEFSKKCNLRSSLLLQSSTNSIPSTKIDKKDIKAPDLPKCYVVLTRVCIPSMGSGKRKLSDENDNFDKEKKNSKLEASSQIESKADGEIKTDQLPIILNSSYPKIMFHEVTVSIEKIDLKTMKAYQKKLSKTKI